MKGYFKVRQIDLGLLEDVVSATSQFFNFSTKTEIRHLKRLKVLPSFFNVMSDLQIIE